MRDVQNGTFGASHPIVLIVYYLIILVFTMFVSAPIFVGIGLLGGVAYFALRTKGRTAKSDALFYVMLVLIVSITNPLFSHNGATPLFFMNEKPVTLEAVLYGVNIAGMLVAVVYWCKCYNEDVSSDKFVFLFGRVIPKLSLVISMAIRMIPLFRNQMKKITRIQKAMGLYASDSYVDKLKSGLRVFSALITWALENAIITGNSMKSRGYGLPGRSSFSLFRFSRNDGFMLGTILLLGVLTCVGLAGGGADFNFYPRVSTIEFSPMVLLTNIAFMLCAFLPAIDEVKESIKWKYCISKI